MSLEEMEAEFAGEPAVRAHIHNISLLNESHAARASRVHLGESSEQTIGNPDDDRFSPFAQHVSPVLRIDFVRRQV